jgi:hypothetical protein
LPADSVTSTSRDRGRFFLETIVSMVDADYAVQFI